MALVVPRETEGKKKTKGGALYLVSPVIVIVIVICNVYPVVLDIADITMTMTKTGKTRYKVGL